MITVCPECGGLRAAHLESFAGTPCRCPLSPAPWLDHAESRESAQTMKARSPIEMMIDAACGITNEPPPIRAPNDEEKEAARDVAAHVIQHIDDMYPKMWDGVPKTARVSVRNTIHNRVASLTPAPETTRDQTTPAMGLCPGCELIQADGFVGGWRGWICGSQSIAHSGEKISFRQSNACASMHWRLRAERAEAKLRGTRYTPPPSMTLHRHDYENQDGKMVRVRKDEIYVWAAVNMTTGEVELDDMPIFDDQLSTLSEPWQWKRFTLTVSDNASAMAPPP